MKTLAFFNGKGGIGKTLHTILFASWLQYHIGANVAIVDCESPTPRILEERRMEERLLSNHDSWLWRYMTKHPQIHSPYNIINLCGGAQAYSKDYLEEVTDKAWQIVSNNEYEYILFDFPAMFLEASPAFLLISSGVIDLTAVPIDVDNSTRREGILTARQVLNNEQHVVAFWNNVTIEDIRRPGYLDSGETIFKKYGIEVLPERVKTFQKAKRDSSTHLFVKSTVCWPERYVEIACPELPLLYLHLKNILDAIN